MRPGAASTSSIEHSSGSDFINQYFTAFFSERSVPRDAGGPASEPWLNRVVAYRSHQVHPASARRARGTITTVTLDPQPGEAIGPEIMGPVAQRRERDLFRTTSPALQSPRRSAIQARRGGAWLVQGRSPSRA